MRGAMANIHRSRAQKSMPHGQTFEDVQDKYYAEDRSLVSCRRHFFKIIRCLGDLGDVDTLEPDSELQIPTKAVGPQSSGVVQTSPARNSDTTRKYCTYATQSRELQRHLYFLYISVMKEDLNTWSISTRLFRAQQVLFGLSDIILHYSIPSLLLSQRSLPLRYAPWFRP